MKDMYYARSIAKRKARRKQVHRNITLLFLSIILVLFFAFFITSIYSHASDRDHLPSYKYYKSIQVASGDSLWSIAEANMDTEHYNHAAEYVAEIKRMNSLESDRIVAGSYLIIPYYSTEFISSQNN